uniref:BHLH domain-containing protein n=1 Tax=Setaria digitata TaxID=48799 RepID=A0A915PVH1_9BILA
MIMNQLYMKSTRGASKYRRDQINLEIQKLRDLLPLSDPMKKRLFQLQIMSLTCIYIRKQNYFPHVVGMGIQTSIRTSLKQSESFRALRGFLLMMTKYGKIVYISDNAGDYLGQSVAEIMCQGDSVYDLIDCRDHSRLQAELMSGPSSVSDQNFFAHEKVFICRMNLSRTAKRQLQYHKYTLIEGRYLHASDYYHIYQSLSSASHIQPLFAAYCEMLINPENVDTLSTGNTSTFCTVHSMDLKFLHVDHIAVYYLGYENEELFNKSWYQFLHPDHLLEVACKHRILSQRKEGAMMCLLRLQAKNGSWLWLHSVFTVKNNPCPQSENGKRIRQLIYITYQVLNEIEALSLQGNIWIYGIRNEIMLASCDHLTMLDAGDGTKQEQISKQYTPPALASLLTVKKESLSVDNNKLIHSNENFKDFNNNEPSSFISLSFGNEDEGSDLEALPELCLERNIKGPLPDLSGDLDKFFEEMEHSKMQANNHPTMIKLPENVKCTGDQLSPALPSDSSLRSYNRKVPTIAKLLQGHFDGEESYESIRKRTRTDGYMQLTDNVDMQLII